jgi:hypothetical protein
MDRNNKFEKYCFKTLRLLSIVVLLGIFSCKFSKTENKRITSIKEFRELRLAKLNQSRPLIHNNDGCDALYFTTNTKIRDNVHPRLMKDTIEGDYELSIPNFLDLRTAGLKGSDVTTISYCTICSGFGLFTYNTKIGEILTRHPSDIMPGTINVVPEFLKLNTDPLKITVQFAHENGFEFFWSNRVNDTHDVEHRSEKPHLLFPKFKEEHPEFLFGSIGERLPHGRWSAVDFSHAEIRKLCVQFYTEVCKNYDVDGIELDFFRHMFLFKNVGKGETATEEQLDMLTDMVTQIREMTEKAGMKKGKPILVLARVPDSFEYCRRVGIDLENWMKLGLVDIVVGSDYFRLNAWDYFVNDCHKYGVKVYAGLSEPRVNKEHPDLIRLQNSMYRAQAAAAWQAGVDGIYSFNEYNTRSQYLREIGNPDKLGDKNNLYFITYRNGNPNSYLKNGIEYAKLPLLSPVNPLTIKSEPLKLMVEIGNESKPSKVFLVLYSSGIEPKYLKVNMNDAQAVYKKSTKDGLIIFEVSQNSIQPGKNNLSVSINDLSKKGKEKNITAPTLLDAAILFYRNADDPELKALTDLCL